MRLDFDAADTGNNVEHWQSTVIDLHFPDRSLCRCIEAIHY